jgi:uncharacterized protein YgbK (DUF1537 family)
MRFADSNEPGRARFSVIADDLTGACDSAVMFADRGLVVEVLLEKNTAPPVDGVWAISTESRDVAEEVAVGRIREAMAMAGQAREVLKKVDSVFRGNTFAEIRAAVESFPCDLAVVSPAHPAMGRMVHEGVLRVRDSTVTMDLHAGLRESGLKDVALVRRGEAIPVGAKVVLCDAETVGELQRTVVEARGVAERVLWVGSGGLAGALAGEVKPVKVAARGWRTEGMVVMFVGSDHAVTMRQMEMLRANALVFEAVIGEAAIEEFSGGAHAEHVVVLNVVRGVTTEEQIRSAVARLSPQRIACAVLTGGDTAMLVSRALGVRSLLLTEEFAPGLPQGVAVGGELNQVRVVLKSGGFGSADVLSQLSHRFAKRKEFV